MFMFALMEPKEPETRFCSGTFCGPKRSRWTGGQIQNARSSKVRDPSTLQVTARPSSQSGLRWWSKPTRGRRSETGNRRCSYLGRQCERYRAGIV